MVYLFLDIYVALPLNLLNYSMLGCLYYQTNLSNLLQGRVSLISVDALHQIHILIFFLAVLHVIYSAITMWLGKLKVIQSIIFINSCIILELLCHFVSTFWNIKRNSGGDQLSALYYLVVSLVHTLSPSEFR